MRFYRGKYAKLGFEPTTGSINFGRMSGILSDGYATSSTDTGHQGFTGEFMLGHPEKLTDFSYSIMSSGDETSPGGHLTSYDSPSV